MSTAREAGGAWRVPTMLAPVLLLGFATAAAAAPTSTLDEVRAKGHLDCGVNTGLPGFSSPDDNGDWAGFDVELCRAVAVAIFGDRSRVRFTPTTARSRFTTLASGEIDLLARNTTWTFTHDADLGFDFVGVVYFDGQAFMVPEDSDVRRIDDLDGTAICVHGGTTSEANLADLFAERGLAYTAVVTEGASGARAAYEAGLCRAYTADASALAAVRSVLPEPGAHRILPETISREPLSPLVRHGDNAWADLVRWTVNALIAAEELGITSANVEMMRQASHPEIRRLLGVEGSLGSRIGLDDDWAYRVIAEVGNYGEIYERTIGPATALGLERGRNALWRDGGLIYALPFR